MTADDLLCGLWMVSVTALLVLSIVFALDHYWEMLPGWYTVRRRVRRWWRGRQSPAFPVRPAESAPWPSPRHPMGHHLVTVVTANAEEAWFLLLHTR